MRVVLDTNVLVSAIYFGGVPGQILAGFRSGIIEPCITPSIFDEYQNIAQTFAASGRVESSSELLDMISSRSIVIDDPPHPLSMCRDPKDEKFLACAAATCAILISGDKDLLSINGALGVSILSPRTFITRHLA